MIDQPKTLSATSYGRLRFAGEPSARIGRKFSEAGLVSTATAERRRPAATLDADQRALAATVFGAAGLSLADYRVGPLCRRMPALLRAVRSPSAAAANVRLADDPELARRAADSLLIGHTAPFRDAPVFDLLQDLVARQLAPRPRPLRVWSLGCSNGAELLSVALLLAAAGRLNDAELRGSDCRPLAIEQARRQPASFWAEAPPERLPWRERVDLQAFEAALRRIDWRLENILALPAAAYSSAAERGWDLALCRNVAIYLEPAAALRLWENIAALLAPGGYLLTGKAERPLGRAWRRVAKCIYQREGGRS